MDQCSSCRFFERRTFRTRATIGGGECRRRPPSVSTRLQGDECSEFGVFPGVMENDWCGEFAPQTATMPPRREDQANAAFDAASHEDATDADVRGLAGNV